MATNIEAIRILNAQESPLLAKLPAELRNTIYELALVCGTEIEIDYVDIHKQTALLRTSLQLREEASRVFFGNNVFGISDTIKQAKDIKQFMECAQACPTDQWGMLSIHFNAPSQWSETFRVFHQACADGFSVTEAVTKVASLMGHSPHTQMPRILNDILKKHHEQMDCTANLLFKSRLSPRAIVIRHMGNGDRGNPNKDFVEEAEKEAVWLLSDWFKNMLEKHSPQVAIQVCTTA